MNRLRLITCLAVLFGGNVCAAQSNDAKFLEGLRERRLYRLIDLHCESRLADAEFPEARLVDVVVAWVRAGTQRALEAPPHERDSRWQRLNDLAELSDRARKAPRAVLIDLQLALATLARAEVLAEQPGDRKGAARTEFRRGLDALKSVDVAVFEKLQRSYQQPASEQDWKTAELEALRRNLLVETARGFRRQALSFPVASPDRINALTLALEKLRAVTGLANLEPTVWRARVEQLVCLRLLQRVGEARSKIDEWHEAQPPAEIASRLAGESLQLDLAAGEVRRALTRAEAMLRDEKNTTVPETDHAILKVLLTARAGRLVPEPGAPEPGAKEQLTQLAAAQVRRIAQRHGPFWKRLAQAELGRALARSSSTDDPELLVHAAASLYQAGEPIEAVATFDRAATEFERAGQEERQFEAAHTAAAIVRQTGDAADAQHRFRQLSLRLPRHPQAAAAHLAAVGLAANRVRDVSVSSQPMAEERYETLLKEQLEIWPRGNEADTVRWWWGRLRMSRNDWPAAMEQFTEVSRESPQFGAAALAAAQCYERELSLLPNGTARVELVAAATEYLQPIVTGAENRWPDEWTDLQRSVALRLSEMQLRYSHEGEEYALTLLNIALRESPEAVETWRTQALSLKVVGLARTGHVDQARKIWNSLPPTSAESALRILEIVDLENTTDRLSRLRLAQLTLAIVIGVHQNETTPKTLAEFALQRHFAYALQVAGKRGHAVSVYERLIAAETPEANAFESYARLLMESEVENDLRRSLNVWQQIERRSKPAGPRWWRARRARIDLLEQLGEGANAKKLRQITTLLYPGAVDELP